MLVLITLGAALVVGFARGGRLRALAQLRPRRGRLLLTALSIAVAGVLAGWAWPTATTILWSLTLLLMAWFCRLNRDIHGSGLVAGGLALNALAGLGHLSTDPPGPLRILGDVIPVALPWTVEHIGPGDVLLAAGLATILATSMVGGNAPVVTGAANSETLDVTDQPIDVRQSSDPDPEDPEHEEHSHGQARTQAQGPQAQQREPREATQQLTRFPA